MAPSDQWRSPTRGAPLRQADDRSSNQVPEPLMRVVTSGWWVLREERASAEDILQADRAQDAAR